MCFIDLRPAKLAPTRSGPLKQTRRRSLLKSNPAKLESRRLHRKQVVHRAVRRMAAYLSRKNPLDWMRCPQCSAGTKQWFRALDPSTTTFGSSLSLSCFESF